MATFFKAKLFDCQREQLIYNQSRALDSISLTCAAANPYTNKTRIMDLKMFTVNMDYCIQNLFMYLLYIIP